MATKQVILRQLQCARGSSAEVPSQLCSFVDLPAPDNAGSRPTLSVECLDAPLLRSRPGYAPLAKDTLTRCRTKHSMHVYAVAIPTGAVCVMTVLTQVRIFHLCRAHPTHHQHSHPPSVQPPTCTWTLLCTLSDTFSFFGCDCLDRQDP